MEWSKALRTVCVFSLMLSGWHSPVGAAEPHPLGHIKCHPALEARLHELTSVRADFGHEPQYQWYGRIPAKNQCGYGGCWVYAAVAKTEYGMLSRDGHFTQLSERLEVIMHFWRLMSLSIRTDAPSLFWLKTATGPSPEKAVIFISLWIFLMSS